MEELLSDPHVSSQYHPMQFIICCYYHSETKGLDLNLELRTTAEFAAMVVAEATDASKKMRGGNGRGLS